GAIYRIRRKGAPKMDDPRGVKIAWATIKPEELAELLGDERVSLQQRAIHELSKRGAASVPALKQIIESGPKRQSTNNKRELVQNFLRSEAGRTNEWPHGAAMRQNAIWALTRIESKEAREAVRLAFRDADSAVI